MCAPNRGPLLLSLNVLYLGFPHEGRNPDFGKGHRGPRRSLLASRRSPFQGEDPRKSSEERRSWVEHAGKSE